MSSTYSRIRHILDGLKGSSFIREYDVLKYEYTTAKFQLRLRIELIDHSVLYTNEYIGTGIRKYAFQWQTADNTWLMRWDNVPHFPKLMSFPHHRHDYRTGAEVVTDSFDISLTDVLSYIDTQLTNS